MSDVYTPLVYGWARRGGLSDADAADVVQEVFRSVFRHASGFEGQNQGKSFRAWLWTITRNQMRLLFRQHDLTLQGRGGTDFVRQLNEYPDWIDDEHDPVTPSDHLALLRRTLIVIRNDFDETTWRAFWRLTVENGTTSEISAELGISPGAVRQAKYRVLCRLREEMGGSVSNEA